MPKNPIREPWRRLLWKLMVVIALAVSLLFLISLGHWIFITFIHPSDRTAFETSPYGDHSQHEGIQQAVSTMVAPGVVHGRVTCNCGDSVSEARSRGCKYDTIMAAWLPPHCRDDELIERFNHAGPGHDGAWQYYSDANKTRQLTLDEVAELADVGGYFFVSHGWHVRHCHFAWLKLFRSRWTGVQMNLRDDTETHITHCMNMAEKRDSLDQITTGSGVALHGDWPPGMMVHGAHVG